MPFKLTTLCLFKLCDLSSKQRLPGQFHNRTKLFEYRTYLKTTFRYTYVTARYLIRIVNRYLSCSKYRHICDINWMLCHLKRDFLDYLDQEVDFRVVISYNCSPELIKFLVKTPIQLPASFIIENTKPGDLKEVATILFTAKRITLDEIISNFINTDDIFSFTSGLNVWTVELATQCIKKFDYIIPSICKQFRARRIQFCPNTALQYCPESDLFDLVEFFVRSNIFFDIAFVFDKCSGEKQIALCKLSLRCRSANITNYAVRNIDFRYNFELYELCTLYGIYAPINIFLARESRISRVRIIKLYLKNEKNPDWKTLVLIDSFATAQVLQSYPIKELKIICSKLPLETRETLAVALMDLYNQVRCSSDSPSVSSEVYNFAVSIIKPPKLEKTWIDKIWGKYFIQ